jgi:hypothetical protein
MSQWNALVSLALIGTSLSACSNHSFLNAMDVAVTTQNNENYLDLSAEVDLGNVSLDQIQIPILDPRTQANLGTIGFSTAPSGKQKITVGVNASAITRADSTLGMSLPNGRPLPGSIQSASGQLLGIPVLNQSRVYIGGDLKTQVVLGVALTLPGLDGVTRNIPVAANLFFQQAFNSQLTGVAGLYTSPGSSGSGIAVFARYTPAQPLILGKMNLAKVNMTAVTPPDSGNQIQNENLSGTDQRKLLKYFYGKKRVLRPE